MLPSRLQVSPQSTSGSTKRVLCEKKEARNTQLVNGPLRNLNIVQGHRPANSSVWSTGLVQAWRPALLGHASFYLMHQP